MNNKKALIYFEKLGEGNIDIKATKINPSNDFSDMDAKFIMKYANKESRILDLASGTGIIINKIHEKVKEIVAIEKIKKFTKFIEKKDNIKVFHQDIFQFETIEKFDLVLMFGILHYLNEDESIFLLKKYKNYLKQKDGILIIKQQFGVYDDVAVSSFINQNNTDCAQLENVAYVSQYRFLDKEMDTLRKIGFKIIEVVDIYPPECNRWDNTHFYAIVAGLD
ncbi:class I SAM-dependent methyltransferase [Campylobacter jejuni]|uniref:class I SAM-dependent methyltransferase n=1 Tax=Campylobacter jejuni TaxID=197 RepID=UPI00119E6195|nr:class I SAM-dependent methyltransferase [Campylobacter jejuni]